MKIVGYFSKFCAFAIACGPFAAWGSISNLELTQNKSPHAVQRDRLVQPELSSHDYLTILKHLGKQALPLDDHSLLTFFRNKRILVTGGAGSIGSEIIHQACRYHPQQIVAVDLSEFQTFQAQRTLHEFCPKTQLVTYLIGSITDADWIEAVLAQYQINMIYHAAAYKHVPLMEENPYQVVRNNVGGTRTLLALAAKAQVPIFVNISTDKAVAPSNAMGTGKRVNELLVRNTNETLSEDFNYVSVRFGNVFGSSGSVGPIFQEQIRKKGPITITHRDMTRYLMSISEAAQLVLVASSFPKTRNGIYILDMGEPVKILDLAQTMIQYLGYRPHDIPIQEIGIRPGEKLHESLCLDHENLQPTSHERIRIVQDKQNTADISTQVDALLQIKPHQGSELIRKELQIIIEHRTSVRGLFFTWPNHSFTHRIMS